MRYLHSMVRVTDLEQSLDFYCKGLGLVELYRNDYPKGRFTLVFLGAAEDIEQARETTGEEKRAPLLELTYNWDPEEYSGGRNFGHLAYRVENIYETCQRLADAGVVINRPPGMVIWPLFVHRIISPLKSFRRGTICHPQEPWLSMPNTGSW